jgi:xanthine/uracil permease
MKCEYCQADLSPQDIICGSCSRNVVQSKEDLQRVDPKSTAAIGYSLAGIGGVTMFFVTINLEVLTLSSLDYLVPTVLLVLGIGTVLYARGLKK